MAMGGSYEIQERERKDPSGSLRGCEIQERDSKNLHGFGRGMGYRRGTGRIPMALGGV
jgi:hypothetical protein